MKRCLYEMSQLPQTEQAKVASYVSEFTRSRAGQVAELLALQPDEILARSLGVVACVGDKFVGYAGRRDEATIEENRVEIGPFIVDPEERYQGHGRALLTKVAHRVVADGQIPFVLGNRDNMHNLTTVGFQPVDWLDLPSTTYRPDEPDSNLPVMLLRQPLYENIPFDTAPHDISLQMPQGV